ncbi:MAG: hypothetical protein V3S82_04770 [Dehalococcoidia bacterium]
MLPRAIQDRDEAIRLDPQDVFTCFERALARASLDMDIEADRTSNGRWNRGSAGAFGSGG